MICMKGENPVHRAGQNWVHLIVFRGHRKAHAEEVGGIIHIIARIDEGLSHRVFIGHCGNGWHFGD